MSEQLQVMNEDEKPLNEPVVEARYRMQFVAGILSCLAPLCAGSVIGYASPAQNDMETAKNERFSMNEQQKSLFSSLATIGALIGGLTAGLMVDFLGRKRSFLVIGLVSIAGWLCIALGDSPSWLYTGRIVTGICIGLSCLTTSVYLTEISSPKIRGFMGSMFQLSVNSGILFVYIFGCFTSWSALAFICISIPVLLVFVMLYMPESPIWLVRNNMEEAAIFTIHWLRGNRYDAHSEAAIIKRQKESESKISIKAFVKPELYRPMIVVLTEMLVQQFCGINVVLFNASDILKNASKSINPNLASVIVACVMVISSFLATALIDKFGRRLLLILSAALMGSTNFSLGGYYFVLSRYSDSASSLWWLPVVSLVVYVFGFSLGFGPVPWLMMSELFPSKARGLASSFVTAVTWSMAFIVTKTYVDMRLAIQIYGVFCFYGTICTFAIPFVWAFVPETKGKSLEAIQRFFIK